MSYNVWAKPHNSDKEMFMGWHPHVYETIGLVAQLLLDKDEERSERSFKEIIVRKHD